jgi:3'-phosphoadenosine 5'-phosphosulfate (PAPS) 3'-phosphatase
MTRNGLEFSNRMVSRVRGREDQWRTQVPTRDGRRISADEILSRKRRTYRTREEAELAVRQALVVLDAGDEIVPMRRADLDVILRALDTAERQLVAATAVVKEAQAACANACAGTPLEAPRAASL